MKVLRSHRCAAPHDGYPSFAACVWAGAEVAGMGAHAVVAYCGSIPQVQLWRSADQARAGRRLLDLDGCGAECAGDHDIARLDLQGTRRAPRLLHSNIGWGNVNG